MKVGRDGPTPGFCCGVNVVVSWSSVNENPPINSVPCGFKESKVEIKVFCVHSRFRNTSHVFRSAL